MTIQEQLMSNMKMYMQNGLKTELMAIRMVNAAIKNKEIALGKGVVLTNADVITIIKKQIKEHKDSLEYAIKLNKEEDIAKLNTYIVVLTSYLPEEMSEGQIYKIISELLASQEITCRAQMGQAMKLVKPELQGKADMSLVSKIVKEILI